MIPLRVLHALGPDADPASDAARAQIAYLVGHHHAAGVLTSGEGATLPGVDVLPYRTGWLSALFGTRMDAIRQVAAWVPDILHVHDLRWLPSGIALAKRLGVALMVSITGYEHGPATRHLRDPRIGWVVLPSERHRAHYLAQFGLSRDRVTYLPPGVDVAACGAVPYRLSEGPLVVGFTGPVGEGSGIPRLAEAIRVLAKSLPVRGRFRPASALDAARLRDCVTSEQLAHIDIAPVDGAGFMAGIDVFAEPGLDDRISAPLCEAMACARPVVAHAWGAMPELVRDGQTALLCPPGEPAALLAALTALADPAKRRELGEAGRALAAERYDIALVGEALVELYRMAIGGTRNSSVKAEGSTVYRRISEARLAR